LLMTSDSAPCVVRVAMFHGYAEEFALSLDPNSMLGSVDARGTWSWDGRSGGGVKDWLCNRFHRVDVYSDVAEYDRQLKEYQETYR
jgi:hypothetical protein